MPPEVKQAYVEAVPACKLENVHAPCAVTASVVGAFMPVIDSAAVEEFPKR